MSSLVLVSVVGVKLVLVTLPTGSVVKGVFGEPIDFVYVSVSFKAYETANRRIAENALYMTKLIYR